MRGASELADYSESDLTVGHQKEHAAGVKAVAVSMKRALGHMGVKRTAQTLLKLNQAEGFDCMSCAWPDPEVGHRHAAEFCENGAKAVAEEATTRPRDPGVLRRAQHRGPGPAVRALARPAGPDHPSDGQAARARPTTTPIDWDEAFALIGAELQRAGQPGRGDLLHLGPGLQRGGVRLPAVRPGVRHQQPARLLEHVPRVDQHRAGRSRSASARPASASRTSTTRS